MLALLWASYMEPSCGAACHGCVALPKMSRASKSAKQSTSMPSCSDLCKQAQLKIGYNFCAAVQLLSSISFFLRSASCKLDAALTEMSWRRSTFLVDAAWQIHGTLSNHWIGCCNQSVRGLSSHFHYYILKCASFFHGLKVTQELKSGTLLGFCTIVRRNKRSSFAVNWEVVIANAMRWLDGQIASIAVWLDSRMIL